MRDSKKREEKFTFENGFALPPFKQLNAQNPDPQENKQVLFDLKSYDGPYKFVESREDTMGIKLDEEEIDNELIP